MDEPITFKQQYSILLYGYKTRSLKSEEVHRLLVFGLMWKLSDDSLF